MPSQLNDPFECKPHWSWPTDPNSVNKIRTHLIKVLKARGIPKKEAESQTSKFMRNPELVRNSIFDSTLKVYSEVRICSFTTDAKNLLFWSHYGNSHRGLCIEFDATIFPISYAYKVQYKDEYPKINYPTPDDQRIFIPFLTKAIEWEYENEYRILFIPESLDQPKNDGKSLLLNGNEITNIYFGACMDEKSKEEIKEMIETGPFLPNYWTTSLSKSSYRIVFSPYANTKAYKQSQPDA